MITELTEENQKMLNDITEEYLKKFFIYRDIDESKVALIAPYIRDDLKFDLADKVETRIVDSPMEAQRLANEINGTKNVFYSFSLYFSCYDLGWLAKFKAFEELGADIAHPLYAKYKELFTDIGIYDSILFNDFFIFVRLPVEIKRVDNILHCENGPAIRFKNGEGYYFWRGIAVPEKLIMAPRTVTKEEILSQENAEVRKCYSEKLGAKLYYDIITDGAGLKKIHTDIDDCGNMMVLWETKKPDDLTGEKIQFLEVECPGTADIFNIYPRGNNHTNVHSAKASTFDNKLTVRQGDVGLVNLDDPNKSDKIEIET